MATVPNTTIILYKGVPLVKGGIDVLLTSGASAATALVPFVHKAFAQCTYTREERSFIRVPATVSECEGCNYLSFRNNNHGGKYYFGFIDKVRYINEVTSQIDFTIDPFPTFSEDASILKDVYVKRNTPISDTAANRLLYLQPDYVPESVKQEYTSLGASAYMDWTVDRTFMYYAVGNNQHTGTDMEITAGFSGTGIRVGDATTDKIKDIKEDGGVIIGAYMMPSSFYVASGGGGWGNNIMKNLGTLTGNPLAHVSSYDHVKLQSGVYNSVMLFTSQGAKAYDLELFSNVNAVSFGVVGLMTPCPSVFIYPQNYKGIANNLAEGVYMKFPAIPITANAVYSVYQSAQNDFGVLGGGVSGFKRGLAAGGAVGAVAGAAMGMLVPYARNAIEENLLTQFKPPSVIGSGDPVISTDFKMFAQLLVASPSQNDLYKISRYFDYYGYSIEAQQHNTTLNNQLNTSDGAFLQTGSPVFAGSEVDDELNARAYAGIKIRKTLSF